MKHNNNSTGSGAGKFRRTALYLFTLALAFSLAIWITGCSGEKEEDEINFGYKVYVPNLSDASISIFPKEESDEPEVIKLEKNPVFIAQAPGQQKLYALMSGTNRITIVETEEDTIDEVFEFEVGTTSIQENYRMIFLSDGSKAFVTTSYEPSGIAVMDGSDHSFIEGIDINSTTAYEMFFGSSENRLYVTDPSRGRIYSIDTASNDLVEDITVPEAFEEAYFNSDDSTFFLAESGTDADLMIYDLTTDEITNRIENITDNIVKLLPSSDGKTLYVVGASEFVTVNLPDFTIEDRIEFTNRGVTDFQYLPNNKYFLVNSASSDLMMVLKPNFDSLDTIDTGRDPGEMVIWED